MSYDATQLKIRGFKMRPKYTAGNIYWTLPKLVLSALLPICRRHFELVLVLVVRRRELRDLHLPLHHRALDVVAQVDFDSKV